MTNPTTPLAPPLPGWIRLRNLKTGVTMDFDQRNRQHMILYARYRDHPDWVATF